MLHEIVDVVVDNILNEIPSKRDINHHIDLIPGESLPS